LLKNVYWGLLLDFDTLADVIFKNLKPKLEASEGLAVFARERSKFEGWLKVELCGILSHSCQGVCPERQRVDLYFDDWSLELKTVNTNIRYEGVENKHRPITKNIQGVIDDIDKLSKNDARNKAVLFIAFPIEHDNSFWQTQLSKISDKLAKLRNCPFMFQGVVAKGMIYIGLVSDNSIANVKVQSGAAL
jgi:hypothetical protein